MKLPEIIKKRPSFSYEMIESLNNDGFEMVDIATAVGCSLTDLSQVTKNQGDNLPLVFFTQLLKFYCAQILIPEESIGYKAASMMSINSRVKPILMISTLAN